MRRTRRKTRTTRDWGEEDEVGEWKDEELEWEDEEK